MRRLDDPPPELDGSRKVQPKVWPEIVEKARRSSLWLQAFEVSGGKSSKVDSQKASELTASRLFGVAMAYQVG